MWVKALGSTPEAASTSAHYLEKGGAEVLQRDLEAVPKDRVSGLKKGHVIPKEVAVGYRFNYLFQALLRGAGEGVKELFSGEPRNGVGAQRFEFDLLTTV